LYDRYILVYNNIIAHMWRPVDNFPFYSYCYKRSWQLCILIQLLLLIWWYNNIWVIILYDVELNKNENLYNIINNIRKLCQTAVKIIWNANGFRYLNIISAFIANYKQTNCFDFLRIKTIYCLTSLWSHDINCLFDLVQSRKITLLQIAFSCN